MLPSTPSEVHELFGRYFSAGAADLLMTLYEDDAVMLSATGQQVVGKDAIREVINGFLAMNGEFRIERPKIVEARDLALLMAKWTLNAASSHGQPIEIGGHTSDVVRRQPDGSWLFVIDNPFGTAELE